MFIVFKYYFSTKIISLMIENYDYRYSITKLFLEDMMTLYMFLKVEQ